MAVAIDRNAGDNNQGSGVTSFDLATFVMGSGTNRAFVAMISSNVTTISNIALSWDSAGTPQAMTQIGSGANCNDVTNPDIVYSFGLLNPTSGTKNLHISWTTVATVGVGAISYTGVDQGSVSGTFHNTNSASGTSNSAAVTITSAVGNYTATATAQGSTSYTGTSQTQILNLSGASSNNLFGSTGTGASVTHTISLGASVAWATAGFDIAATGTVGPVITVQPVQTTVVSGQTANFTITATGTGTLHYQWKLNGSNVGSDSSSYTTAATVNSDNLSTVQCVVTDDSASTNSDTVYLLVIPTAIVWLYTA